MEKPWLKFYDEGVPATIEYPDIPVHQALADAAARFPDRAGVIFGAPLGRWLLDASISYRELNSLADRFAAALQKMGVQKGDRVAIHLPNCPQFVIGYYGALKAGAIVVPCNPLYVARELEYQLNDSGAETILSLSAFYNTIRSIRAKTPLKRVLVTNIKEYFPPLLRLLFTLAREKKEGHRVDIRGDPETYWFQDVLREAPSAPAPVEVTPQDTAVLLYTGGTTGIPKGAELTHRNLVSNSIAVGRWGSIRQGQEVMMTALPLFHSYGMTVCMNCAIAGAATLVLIPNPRDIVHIMKAIEKHRATFYPGVPTMYVAINTHPRVKEFDLSSIIACLSGAAPLPVEVQQRFQELTGGKLVEGFGLTESGPVTHANPVYGLNKIGTIGIPIPDTEAKIVDVETGTQEMPIGEAGELIVRGPQTMKGYWNRPDETAQTLRDGWLYTGDIATMDEDGYFTIVDRKKDMIIAGGFNIYPREVEEVLYKHPKVQKAAVIGIPDPYRGETVKAYVVLKAGETATEEEIIAFCRDNLARYKVPTAVEFRSSLPETMVGKILRRALREEEMKKAQ